jgi:hypothetical protein
VVVGHNEALIVDNEARSEAALLEVLRGAFLERPEKISKRIAFATTEGVAEKVPKNLTASLDCFLGSDVDHGRSGNLSQLAEVSGYHARGIYGCNLGREDTCLKSERDEKNEDAGTYKPDS